jgi:sterol desaturase/sphingolipid hydroxylase (fatty acid hydroxylase superfamily)
MNVLVSFLFFDLVIYWQHRLFHRLPWPWRLHRLHHSDVEFDTTTALRFHPLEIMISMLVKMLAVIAIGANPLAIVVFEIGLNLSAMFNHANIQLPAPLEKWARYLLITPDLHRIHHSIDKNEHHRNFGFCLSWWDYLFSSWCGRGQKADQVMAIGLPDFRSPKDHSLWAMLRQPWR